jgi:hypothetical protein
MSIQKSRYFNNKLCQTKMFFNFNSNLFYLSVFFKYFFLSLNVYSCVSTLKLQMFILHEIEVPWHVGVFSFQLNQQGWCFGMNISCIVFKEGWKLIRGCIFSRVRPFYERGVSDLETKRSMHRPVYYAHSLFIEG